MNERYGAHIVNYADDFVICCRGKADEALEAMREIMERLKSDGEREEDHVCRVPEETSTFWATRSDGATRSRRVGPIWARDRRRRGFKRLLEYDPRARPPQTMPGLDADEVVLGLNRELRGWSNYFSWGQSARLSGAGSPTPRTAPSVVLQEAQGPRQRMRPVLRTTTCTRLGLVRLPALTRNLPWAKA